jgi:aryl-alcohol dehydrogenase-like predicted oxidoreductase
MKRVANRFYPTDGKLRSSQLMQTPASHPTLPSRLLGRSGLRVSSLGLGCWPIGGRMYYDGKPDHYGEVDDAESIRAIHAAIDAGVTLFDTADCYGAGHSETVLGRALVGRRSGVVVATKFGNCFDAASRQVRGEDVSPAYIRQACQASLARLQTDVIDLYQIHCWALPPAQSDDAAAALESLCDAGLIRAWGWSTDELPQVQRMVSSPRFSVLQHEANVFSFSPEAHAWCKREDIGLLARSPLAMGLLGGRYDAQSRFSADNVRGSGHAWVKYFRDGRPAPNFLRQLDAVREILTSGGRSVAQGALAYLWGKSDRIVPIPGFKSTAQALENATAMQHGPLSAACIQEIDTLLRRVQTGGAAS